MHRTDKATTRPTHWLARLIAASVIAAIAPVVAASSASSTPGKDDYPSNLKNAAQDSLVDPWRFYNRECTSFVAWRLNNDNKVGFSNSYKQPSGYVWGNADAWKAAAQRAKITVNSTPAVGAVAWWSAMHVAWVRAVSGSNVTIEEYNYDYAGHYHTRTIAASSVNGFIHIKDLALTSTKAPAISGTVKVGSKLTASAGSWSWGGASYKYQWLANGAAISGATASTFTPTASQYGKQLQVKVTATESGYVSGAATSGKTAAVAAGTISSTAGPTISGTPQVEQQLTASTGSWSVSGLAYGYQWSADGVDIPGATTSTFTPGTDQFGKQIRVRVTASRTAYSTTSATSAATAAVAPGVIANTAAPVVTGKPQVGVALTAGSDTWAPETVERTYQWLADGSPIGGATDATFTPAAAQRGKHLEAVVTAASYGYTTISATSAPTETVAAGHITAARPRVSGKAKVGKTLRAVPGTTSPRGVAIRYVWLRNGKAVAHATKATYRLTKKDVGKRISVRVVRSKDGYRTLSLTSARTSAVKR